MIFPNMIADLLEKYRDPIVVEYVNVLRGGVPHSLSTESTRMFNDFSRKELVHHPIDSQPF